MTDPLPVPAPLPRKTNWRLVGRGFLLALLLGLCGFGLATTPFWAQHSLTYWLWMTSAFGLLSLLLCSLYERQRFTLLRWKVVQHQVLLWIGTTAAIFLLFRFIEKGVLKPEAAGPAATIIIALSIYMAGITFDWRLIVIALLLSVMAVGAIFLERLLVLVFGILLTLGIAYILLRPVIKGWRTTETVESPPAPLSSEPDESPR
ncbi:MAG: hypothetical protein MUC57_13005 [Desulfobacterales bacterium]|jgi:hypothetical protein|nr:hypothetical protein [Desulfobacterales bacterium]